MARISSTTDWLMLRRQASLLAIVSSWAQRGLFALLAERPRSINELPADPRALRCTIPLLINAGILESDGPNMALTPEALTMERQAAWPSDALGHLADLTQLPSVLATGGPLRDAEGRSRGTDGGVRRCDPQQMRAFLDMLYQRSGESCEVTARWLAGLWPAKSRLLDLGGGHGRYARMLCDLGHDATLYDIPEVIEMARERHGSTLHYLGGDFLCDSLGGQWDGIFVSNVLHGLGEAENRMLLTRLRAALHPQGKLVIKDMFLKQSGGTPDGAAAFALNMLFFTDSGQSYALATVAGWCQDAGFAHFKTIHTPTFQLCLAW